MNYLKKFISFITITLLFPNPVFCKTVKPDSLGTWCWNKNSSTSTFSLKITKKGNIYVGGYDAVAYSGDKMDDNEHAFNFKTPKNIIKTSITAGISGKTGIIQLKNINKNTLEWTILRVPEGEFYPPEKAILKRC